MKFDACRDNLLIAAGTHFRCSGHLTAVPITEQSQDIRYCKACFDLLNVEAKTLKESGDHHKKDWMPTTPKSNTVPSIAGKAGDLNNCPVPGQVTPAVTDKFCLICGNGIPGKRTDRKYCSPGCRQKACRGQLELAGVA